MQFSKGKGYKINIQKLFVFLYKKNEYMDTKIKNTIECITPQKNKYLGRNLQHLYMTYILKDTQ